MCGKKLSVYINAEKDITVYSEPASWVWLDDSEEPDGVIMEIDISDGVASVAEVFSIHDQKWIDARDLTEVGSGNIIVYHSFMEANK